MAGTAASAEARALALAYVVEADVEDGRFRSVAEVARALGLSRARLSQVMRRRWAGVAAQERILGEVRSSPPRAAGPSQQDAATHFVPSSPEDLRTANVIALDVNHRVALRR